MIPATALVFGLVVPALLAAVIVVAGRGAATDRLGWLAGAALVLGYVCGHVGFLGWPALPARTAEQWIPYAALAALAVSALGHWPARTPRWPGWLMRAAVLGVALVLWLRPMMTYQWTGLASAGWLAGLLGLALGVCFGLEGVLPALDPRAAWATILCTLLGVAVTLALSGSLALGEIAGSAAAAAGGGFVVVSLGPTRRPIRRTSILALVTLLTGFLVCGAFYSELPRASALLLLGAPFAARAIPRSLAQRSPWAGISAAGAVVLLVAAIAAAVAVRSSPPGLGY
jgi:hypothetical protein